MAFEVSVFERWFDGWSSLLGFGWSWHFTFDLKCCLGSSFEFGAGFGRLHRGLLPLRCLCCAFRCGSGGRGWAEVRFRRLYCLWVFCLRCWPFLSAAGRGRPRSLCFQGGVLLLLRPAWRRWSRLELVTVAWGNWASWAWLQMEHSSRQKSPRTCSCYERGSMSCLATPVSLPFHFVGFYTLWNGCTLATASYWGQIAPYIPF